MLASIGIIPDGNRRYCKKKDIDLDEGYSKSIDKVFKIIEWCKEFKIKSLTIWGFSTENWGRSKVERKILFKLFGEKAKEILEDNLAKKEGVKIRVFGNKDKLPKNLKKIFDKVERETRKNNKFYLNILLNYGGRKEIISAVNKILKKNKKSINEKSFEKELWIQENPDLIIRTSGEMRLSGFLSFQGAYSELYFTKKYFPELTKKDFKNIIENYKKRERRFGK